MKVIQYTLSEAITGRAAEMRMNRAQRDMIKLIADRLPEFDFYSRPDKYKIKHFDIIQFVPDSDDERRIFGHEARPVYVSFTTGMIYDEGTLATVYCRKSRHFQIGPRGGIRSGNWNGKILSGFRSCSIFDLLNRHYTH